MVKFWEAIKRALWCNHTWICVKDNEDHNLRAGYSHWSKIYHCQKCGRNQTREMTDDPGPP